MIEEMGTEGITHRRKENLDVNVERRVQVDQRQGYQRKSNRRSGRDRRND